MTNTTKTKTTKAKRPPDPALVTGKKAAEAAAAFNAFAGDETSPEWVAAERRTTEADAAFADAPVTSAAGALAKMEALRATVMSPSIDPDETYLVARHFNTVVAFLQDFTGAASVIADDPAVVATFPAPAPKPDPVVTLFAKWAIDRDEATAHSDAIDALDDDAPEGTGDELNTRMEAAWARTDALEDRIMETPATTMRGVAIKIRIVSHYIFEVGDFDKRYATPARDIDYIEGAGGKLGADESYVISALRDAERLAGVS